MKNVSMLALILIFSVTSLCAQTTDTTASASYTAKLKMDKKNYPKNNIKMNIPGMILFNNYHFSYERMLTRKISVTGSFRLMPTKSVTSTTLGKKVAEKFINASDYNDVTASNKAYTLECRFYGGKHPGARGFYFALYGRYTDFDIYYPYDFYSETNQHYLIPLNSTIHGIGGGIGMGAQWLIAKRITLDWNISGVHFGSLNGNAAGKTDLSSLSEKDKQKLEEDINSLIDIAGKKYISSTVTNEGVQATIKGPFIGIKTGISIGIAF